MQTSLLFSEQQNISVAHTPGLARYEPMHRQQILTKTGRQSSANCLTIKKSQQPSAYSNSFSRTNGHHSYPVSLSHLQEASDLIFLHYTIQHLLHLQTRVVKKYQK